MNESEHRREATLESRLGRAGDPQKLDAQATGVDTIKEPKPGRRRDAREEAPDAASDGSDQPLGHP